MLNKIELPEALATDYHTIVSGMQTNRANTYTTAICNSLRRPRLPKTKAWVVFNKANEFTLQPSNKPRLVMNPDFHVRTVFITMNRLLKTFIKTAHPELAFGLTPQEMSASYFEASVGYSHVVSLDYSSFDSTQHLELLELVDS